MRLTEMCIRTLLDGVEGLILGDLKLGVGPSRDFNNHCLVSRALSSSRRGHTVEDGLGLVGKEGNVAESQLEVTCRDWATYWKGETTLPFCSMNTRCSRVFAACGVSDSSTRYCWGADSRRPA
jgi:hypothetical protein